MITLMQMLIHKIFLLNVTILAIDVQDQMKINVWNVDLRIKENQMIQNVVYLQMVIMIQKINMLLNLVIIIVLNVQGQTHAINAINLKILLDMKKAIANARPILAIGTIQLIKKGKNVMNLVKVVIQEVKMIVSRVNTIIQ